MSGGPTRSTHPHQRLDNFSDPHQQSADSADPQEGYPPENGETPPRGGVFEEEAPLEESLGSHSGGKKKKEKPIWEDPKRWYAETMGEVPKIEWQPREEARDEVQKRLRDDEGGG